MADIDKKELKDILGTCEFIFKQRVANQIKFGTKGRVLMCQKDEEMENGYSIEEYKSAVLDVEDTDTETRLKQIFKYEPKKVTVFTYSGRLASHKEVLKTLVFDYIFSLDADEQETVASYAKENECFGVVYNLKSDNEYVISVPNPAGKLADGKKIDGLEDITGIDLLPVAVGLLAGCPYDMSATGFVLTELDNVTPPEEYDDGQFTFYNEEEGVRVASPVNTLVTTSATKTEDMKYITIMEGIRRFKTDIRYTFRVGYKGKYKNRYDNQALFKSACMGYIRELVKADILDEEYDNTVDIDVEYLREKWIASGKDEEKINSLSDNEMKRRTYKDVMALVFDVKFLNAIESCKIRVEMY